MKPRNSSLRSNALILAGSITALLTSQPVHAATFYWDGGTVNIVGNGNSVSAGGTGNWSTSISNWDNGNVAHTAWITGNTADFGGTAGTVSLTSAISAGGLIFETSGYTIRSAASQVLTLTGAIDTGAAGTTSIINAKLTGASVPINGSGTITFGGSDDNSGFSMVVNSGVTAILAKASSATVHVTGGTGVVVNTGGLARLGTAGTGGDQMADTAVLNLQGGTFDLNGKTETINTLTGTSTGIVDNMAAGVAALTVGGNNGSASFDGTIRNTGGALALTKIGTGTATLSGVNTYTGQTTVTAGTLAFTKQGSLYNGTSGSWTPTNISVASGAALGLGVGDSASGYFDSTALDTFLNVTHMGASTPTTGFASGSALGIDTTNATAGTFTYSSNITDFGTAAGNGIVKLGAGTLILSGTNTYTGATKISAGTLSAGVTANLGGATSNLVFDGGTLQVTGTTLTNFSGIGHTVSFNATKTVGLDINNAANTFTVDQVLNQTTGGFTKLGAGTAVLNQTNTYTGATTISAGTLQIGNGGATGSLATGSAITNNANLTINRDNALTVGNAISGSGALNQIGTGTTTLTGTNTFTGATNVNVGTLSLTSAGALGTAPGTTGTSGVTVANGATLLIDGVTIAYGTTASGGDITISGSGVGGVGALNFGSTGANSRFSTGVNATGRVIIANGDSAAFGSTRTSAGNIVNRITGGTSLSPVSLSKVGAGILSWETGNTYVGTVAVAAGTLNLATTTGSAITGAVTVNSGATLSLGRTNNQIADSADVTVNGTFDLNNDTNTGAARPRNETIGSLSGTSTGVITTTSTVNSSSGINSGNLLTSAASGTTTYAGTIQDGTRQVLFTKDGAYTQILSGPNTYTGATTVNGGTLHIASGGSLAAGSAVTVSNSGSVLIVNGTVGGTLLANASTTVTGSGTISGAATIQGNHNPGNSPGIQTFGSNLTYSGGSSVVNWEIGLNTDIQGSPTAAFDQINVGGNLDFTNLTTLNLSFNGAGGSVLWADNFWSSDHDWLIYDVAGITSNFGNLDLATINWFDSGSNPFDSARPDATFSLSQSGQDVLLRYSAVPEPTTSSLVGFLIGAGLLRRRRSAK